MPFLGEGHDADGLGLLVVDWDQRRLEYHGLEGGRTSAKEAEELLAIARQEEKAGRTVHYLFVYANGQMASHDGEGFIERFSPWSDFYQGGRCPLCDQPIPPEAAIDSNCPTEGCAVTFRVPGEGDGKDLVCSHREAMEDMAASGLPRDDALVILTLLAPYHDLGDPEGFTERQTVHALAKLYMAGTLPLLTAPPSSL